MRLMIFGLGYVGRAVAALAASAGIDVSATTPDQATHLLVTAPPGDQGDPLLARLGRDALSAAPALRWIGYLSTIGVYGDRNGAWVDETTPPAPSSDRARQRVAAEEAWAVLADRRAVDIFRLAGIYGPGRSAFDDLRAGTARRIIRPGHAFGRIHRDDIARAVCAAMHQDRAPGTRILHLADDEPAESAVIIAEAAALLGMAPPPEIQFEAAEPAMSPMARSFWAENRKVSSRATQEQLGLTWLYPTYREGLRAILREERGEGLA